MIFINCFQPGSVATGYVNQLINVTGGRSPNRAWTGCEIRAKPVSIVWGRKEGGGRNEGVV